MPGARAWLFGMACAAAACTDTLSVGTTAVTQAMDASAGGQSDSVNQGGAAGVGVGGMHGDRPDARVDDHPDARRGDGGGCVPMPAQPITARQRVGTLMISLDRSTGMLNAKDQANDSWWATTQMALQNALVPRENAISVGLETFPVNDGMCMNMNSCCAGSVGGGFGLGFSPQLKASSNLTAAFQCNNRPLQCSATTSAMPLSGALDDVQRYFSGHALDDRFLLLLTHGDPSCASDGSDPCDAAVASMMKLQSSDVFVFVIGVGDEAAQSACLPRLRDAMGARGLQNVFIDQDPNKFKQDVENVFDAAKAGACRVTLLNVVTNADLLEVRVDGQVVNRDPTNGWTFEPVNSTMEIRFWGSACDALQAAPGAVTVAETCMMCPGSDVCH